MTALVLAGAQRSCSTSLAELLSRHPRVSMVKGEVLALEDPYYPRGMDELLAHIERSVARGLVPGLKRPELLHRQDGASRVREHLPDAVVVVVLREPVARTVSAYHHYVRHGVLPGRDLDAGLSEILDHMARCDAPNVASQVVSYSRYADGVRRLRRDFGDRLLVFYQEEVVSDTAGCTKQILELTGVDAVDLGELPRVNTGYYSLRRWRLSSIGGRIGYEQDESQGTFRITVRPLRRRVAHALFALDRLAPPGRVTAPTLSPGPRGRLVEALADDLEALPGVVGRPVPAAWAQSLSA